MINRPRKINREAMVQADKRARQLGFHQSTQALQGDPVIVAATICV
ncbi:MAG: hypothetical protein V2J11_06720 [Desulfofustis sp.]|nr:hypothetical protein [Desulfofustis sp.]